MKRFDIGVYPDGTTYRYYCEDGEYVDADAASEIYNTLLLLSQFNTEHGQPWKNHPRVESAIKRGEE